MVCVSPRLKTPTFTNYPPRRYLAPPFSSLPSRATQFKTNSYTLYSSDNCLYSSNRKYFPYTNIPPMIKLFKSVSQNILSDKAK